MSDTVVYLGPTLSRVAAEKVLTAEYLPPIRRGDLARLREEVRFVGIVDGEFYQSLAVSPKELLPLLKRGVKVFGASSMGALRAAETYTLGTVGIGRVFGCFETEYSTAMMRLLSSMNRKPTESSQNLS